MDPEPTVLARVDTPRGELVLRRVGEYVEVISNGMFLMDTRGGTSERMLVREALADHPHPGRLLLGGLGVGFSLREAVAHPQLRRIDVVEIEEALLVWHRDHLRSLTGAALTDPRVRVVISDVQEHLAVNASRYDVICLDVDNGPDWTLTPGNARLYESGGLATVAGSLTPGGVLAVWSAQPSPRFDAEMRRHLPDVRTIEVETRLARGGPDVVYLGRSRGAS